MQDVKIYICCHKDYKDVGINNPCYKLISDKDIKNDSKLELIKSDGFLDNRMWSELTQLYYIWKHPELQADWIGFCHYRRYFDFMNDVPELTKPIVATNITAKIELASYSKKVPVNVLTTGKMVSGKAISSIKINDTNVSDYLLTIYGEESVIDSIESVPVTIDISGQGNNGSKAYNVTISKPSGVRSISEPKATITLSFGEAKQKSIIIKGIKTRNVPNGLVANLESAEDSNVEVQVVGVEEVINAIDPTTTDIEAYVDLTGYAVGTYSVSVEIRGNDSRLQYIVTKKVNVVLSNQTTN